jgi:hypothetical protein
VMQAQRDDDSSRRKHRAHLFKRKDSACCAKCRIYLCKLSAERAVGKLKMHGIAEIKERTCVKFVARVS